MLVTILVGAWYLIPQKPKPCPCAANKNIGQL